MKKETANHTRRDFVKTSLTGIAGAFVLPTIIPSSVFGKTAPSNKIHIAQIGFWRIALAHDLPLTIKHDITRVIAIADVDSNRLVQGKKWVLKARKELKKYLM